MQVYLSKLIPVLSFILTIYRANTMAKFRTFPDTLSSPGTCRSYVVYRDSMLDYCYVERSEAESKHLAGERKYSRKHGTKSVKASKKMEFIWFFNQYLPREIRLYM